MVGRAAGIIVLAMIALVFGALVFIGRAICGGR
jgi:hypothetical protein